MFNVLIWGTGAEYNRNFNCIKLLEYKGEISVVGVTSNDKDVTVSIDNYQFIKKDEIPSLNFDYCIVTIMNFCGIIAEAERLGIHKSKLIPSHVLSIPHFNFNDYIRLKNSSLTIFSTNCWAGICYHRLGLEFLSPTINMFEDQDDFNRFMMDLDSYLLYDVEFAEMQFESILKRDYPVGILGEGGG